MTHDPSKSAQAEWQLLRSYIDEDPNNPSLLCDAGEAALNAGETQTALDLFRRAEQREPLQHEFAALMALAAMRLGQFENAAQTWENLLSDHPEDHSVRYNLAWCRSQLGDIQGARVLIDHATALKLPQAAALLIELLHRNGDFDEAHTKATVLIAEHPDHPELNAVTSVLALDVNDTVLASQCASKAGDNPIALTTLGTLAMLEGGAAQARDMFDQALRQTPNAPRALIGRGLTDVVDNNLSSAASLLDRGAEAFGDHLGSWLAAGWAYLLANDRETARDRFEKAYSLDSTFSEIHGSLAVIDVLDGHVDSAKKRIITAQRLDRNCFSAVLANIMALNAKNDHKAANAMFERALTTPVGNGDTTLQSLLVRLAQGG